MIADKYGIERAARKLNHSSTKVTKEHYIVPEDRDLEIEDVYQSNVERLKKAEQIRAQIYYYGQTYWQQLGMIYEGSFGVDPKEAAEILSDHLFNKGWVGNEKTPGRMWQDNETCAAFVWYLKEVEIYRKQNNLSFSKAVERMCSINHPNINCLLFSLNLQN